MKFFHLSDLHIGRQLNHYDLSEIQRDVLHQILVQMEEQHPDALLICGDIYDKSVPSGEAYQLFNDFLEQLNERKELVPVFLIAGNHDSPDRLNYASAFLRKHQIYISAYPPHTQKDHLQKITLEDAYGPVDFYLLPFVKPSMVRPLFPEGNVDTYEDAVRQLIEREEIDRTRRNVILSHQFYVNGTQRPETCDSEIASINVGGLDSIDIRVLDAFDYVALGHIHGKQQVGRPSARYCGTPYKYSVSEANHQKTITMVTLQEKGTEPLIEEIPFTFLRDVRKEKGTLQEILDRATQENQHDYLSVTLTDEQPQFMAKEKLEEVYDAILDLHVENQRMQQLIYGESGERKVLDPFLAFAEFFRERQDGREMNESQKEIMQEIIADARGEVEE
ncbi:MAG: exonuclease SbcCD subunit D [Lachnospiraceae bacterium]